MKWKSLYLRNFDWFDKGWVYGLISPRDDEVWIRLFEIPYGLNLNVGDICKTRIHRVKK